VPYWVGGLGALFSGLYWLMKRREKVMEAEGNEEKKGDDK
jgi:hypothetical protein